MSWSYRKSFGSSPFKINFSKSGVSYSMGVKGARVNISSRGTYVNLSSHGITYRQRINSPTAPVQHTTLQPQLAGNIGSAHVEQLTDTDSKAFITELSQKSGLVSYARLGRLTLFALLFILLVSSFGQHQNIVQVASDTAIVKVHAYGGTNIRKAPNKKSPILQTAAYDQTFLLIDSSNQQWFKVGSGDSTGYINRELADIDHVHHEEISEEEWQLVNPYFAYEVIACLVFFIPFIYWLKKIDKKRFEIELHYDMDDKYQQVYQQFSTHFATFSKSAKIWQHLNAQSTDDHKRNAGAGKLIRRTGVRGVSINKIPIPHFITNVSIPCIALNNMELFFLPERLLIKRGKIFAAVFYKNLHIISNVIQFIESEILPVDATVVDYTWQYVNKNGGPDRRFNNNRKLPVCAYSEYKLTSDTGIFEIISTSKMSSMDAFADFLSKIGALQSKIGGMS